MALRILPGQEALTHESALRLISYSPDTGEMRWKIKRRGKGVVGCMAGSKKANGYISIRINGKAYLAHRLAWFIHYGVWPTFNIDHKDGNKTNNSICNLRDIPQSHNLQNINIPNASGSSGFRGVSFCKRSKKWKAHIGIHGRQRYLGVFRTRELAHSAYLEAKKKFHAAYIGNLEGAQHG